MATLLRRLVSLLPRAGLHLTNLGPGTVVLSRNPDVSAVDLGGRAWLVARGDNPRIRRFADGTALISRPRELRRHIDEVQRGFYKLLTPEHVAWMLRMYRVTCVIDVGANIGQYAKGLRQAGYTGRIASFEPLPHLLEPLREAARDDPDWHIYPVALGRDDREMEMHVVGGSMSSMLPPSEFGTRRYKRFRAMHSERVPMRRLDGMLDEILDGLPRPRPYLKLDTQGFDLEVFAGLGERARELVGLQSEVALVPIYEDMPRMPEALRAYERAGFEVTGMFPVSREENTGRVLEFDCVMVRPEAAARRPV